MFPVWLSLPTPVVGCRRRRPSQSQGCRDCPHPSPHISPWWKCCHRSPWQERDQWSPWAVSLTRMPGKSGIQDLPVKIVSCLIKARLSSEISLARQCHLRSSWQQQLLPPMPHHAPVQGSLYVLSLVQQPPREAQLSVESGEGLRLRWSHDIVCRSRWSQYEAKMKASCPYEAKMKVPEVHIDQGSVRQLALQLVICPENTEFLLLSLCNFLDQTFISNEFGCFDMSVQSISLNITHFQHIVSLFCFFPLWYCMYQSAHLAKYMAWAALL